MKILFLTKEYGDCVGDQIFYGLRKLYGVDCIDFPHKDIMYKNDITPSVNMYGRGFTTWKNLPEIKIDGKKIFEMIAEPVKDKNYLGDYFDVIIFQRIFEQQKLFVYLKLVGALTAKSKIVFLDGEDEGFPAVTEAFNFGTYFKRDNPYKYPQVKKISISIPEEKVAKKRKEKKRIFSTFTQCKEAYRIEYVKEYCTDKYVFNTEREYYDDLDISKYGVTMKKSAWDVPRNYENAARYVVNCIYNFDDKPEEMPPYGLVDGKNCLSFRTAEELMKKIDDIERAGRYKEVQEASHQWALENTSEKWAKYVIDNI